MFRKEYFESLSQLLGYYYKHWIVGSLSVQVVTTHGSYLLAGPPIDSNEHTVTLPYYDDEKSRLAPKRAAPDLDEAIVPPAVSLPYECIVAVHLLPSVPRAHREACSVSATKSIGFPESVTSNGK